MSLVPIMVVILLTGSIVLQTTTSPKQKSQTPNAGPTIKSFTASTASVCAALPGCPNTPHSRTTLQTVAFDPDRDVLTYGYSVPAGRIEGTGATVVWNLEKQKLGAYTAVVTVKDQKGNKTRASVIVRADICYLCDPPPCPTISVACPSELVRDKLIEFIATLQTDSNMKLSFRWRTSSGKIVAGKNENKLTVKPLGVPFETVTATVSVRGANPSCTGTEASCTTTIKQ